jgi:hypothetical protein
MRAAISTLRTSSFRRDGRAQRGAISGLELAQFGFDIHKIDSRAEARETMDLLDGRATAA